MVFKVMLSIGSTGSRTKKTVSDEHQFENLSKDTLPVRIWEAYP